jgi:hypothetical protein
MKRLLVLALLAFASPAFAQAPADSLDSFLKGLADSTDAAYGAQSVTFDTSGIDTLAMNALTRPPAIDRRVKPLSVAPLLGFHRAEGWIAGLGGRFGSRKAGWLEASGTYGFSNKEGRYAAGYRRTLLWRGPQLRRTLVERGRIFPGTTRLDAEVRYARASLPFAPEHSTPRLGNPDAFITGKTSSSLYEQRGWEAALTFWHGDVRLEAGVRHEDEQPMPLVNDWTLLTKDAEVPPNTLAAFDRYTEPFGSIGWLRTDIEAGALLEYRGTSSDRWRMRGVLAKALRLGPPIKAYAQVEYGAAARAAPRQRRFEFGGPRAIPTLDIDTGGTDHMILGKVEFIEAHDLLNAVHLPHPDWLVLQPLVGVHGGALWDHPSNSVLARVPGEAWVGSAYAGVAYRLGIPEPDVLLRMYVAWPIGPNSGDTTFRMSVRAPFDLLGRL